MEERVVKLLDLDDILPNRFQPRIKFDEEAITELADSIKEHGVIQPIIVREIGNKYEIIAGERRYKASVLAGMEKIPAIVNNLDDRESAEIALIENVQRQDLTPIEEAVSYKKILDMGYLTQEELASRIDKKQSTVSNKLRLLNLSDDAQEALLNEKISERHARSLLRIENEALQTEMLNKIINERLTVRKTDDEIDKLLNSEETNEVLNEEETGEQKVMEEVKIPTGLNIPTAPILDDDIEELIIDDIFEEPKPSFLDIDSIKTNSEDIIVDKPLADIEELLRGTALSKESEEKINQNAINSGKFFTFETPEVGEKEEEKKPFNFMSDFDFAGTNTRKANDIKVAINTINDCINKIKNQGYVVNKEESESDDFYEITIKIEKN